MKLWGGRFQQPTDKLVERFTSSIDFDRRLYRHDIAGSIAHCQMLATQGIIEPVEAERITAGLLEVLVEIERGEFTFRLEHEDIHMNVEARLRERIGDVAGKLHTARSRNDQVALDVRMYLREAILEVVTRIADLQAALLGLASRHADVVMPGYTHLQRAQPVLFAHHLLAYFEMLQRDVERLRDAYRRTNVMPLGSGALAGLPYPIDRERVARALGFATISRNSMDAVADRDFVVEFLADSALLMSHLSRLAEEIILWCSSEFGFVEVDDAYSTGSSIMPQKKNPDVAELVRGKTGRVYGHLIGLLTTLKGLPLTYNKDLQEDKEPLFDTVDTLLPSLETFAGMLATTSVRRERMVQAAGEHFVLATDVADYLARKGVPFRDAHAVVGRLVAWCIERGKTFDQLSLDEYRQFSPVFDADVREITVATSVAARDVPGGTAPRRVAEALDTARGLLDENRAWVESEAATLRVALGALLGEPTTAGGA